MRSHLPIPEQSEAAGQFQTSATTFVIPGEDAAAELSWSSRESKQRGIFGFDSLDPRSRSFNLMRSKIFKMTETRGWRLVGIVSATPNVGKSFIAANLAASLSRDPRHLTTLLDLDLRRGSLSALFGLKPEFGLREYLEQDAPTALPEIYRLERERLLLMPTRAGPIPSAELLAGESAQILFRSLRLSEQNRLFIADLPPVFANDDAAAVMTRLDAYILVTEEGKTRHKEIVDAVALLGHERLAGIILNKYRAGVLSEGYGVDSYYAAGYEQASLSDQ